MVNVKSIISTWNRYRKEKFPGKFTSRKKYNHLREKYDLLAASIASPENPFQRKAKINCVIPFEQKNKNSEVCFFVSYSPAPQIKPHVRYHIEELLAAGLEVVLVINTDEHDANLDDCSDDSLGLSGLYIRENIGFDFSAWSHVYALTKPQISTDRIYLINDSVIGPLSRDMFASLLKDVRKNSAALIGLTQNALPRYHVQSYFLVLNAPILRSQLFSQYFENIWALPTKEMVIDTYETNLTQAVMRMGFDVSALFPPVGETGDKTDNVLHHVDQLVARGFPYVKTSVATTPTAQQVLHTWLPQLVVS